MSFRFFRGCLSSALRRRKHGQNKQRRDQQNAAGVDWSLRPAPDDGVSQAAGNQGVVGEDAERLADDGSFFADQTDYR